MKKILSVAITAAAFGSIADAKTLVAYYSRSGNTAHTANLIQAATDADIFEIKTAHADYYPTEYTPMTQVAKQEIENGTLPPINDAPDLTQYETIFVGTPIWWGTMASPVRTFLKNNSFAGKNVIPFATHGGGGAGTAFQDIANLTTDATNSQGYSIYGDNATSENIDAWLKQIDVK